MSAILPAIEPATTPSLIGCSFLSLEVSELIQLPFRAPSRFSSPSLARPGVCSRRCAWLRLRFLVVTRRRSCTPSSIVKLYVVPFGGRGVLPRNSPSLLEARRLLRLGEALFTHHVEIPELEVEARRMKAVIFQLQHNNNIPLP